MRFPCGPKAASGALLLLLLIQPASAIAVSAQAPSPAPAPPTGTAAPAFTPDYLILGQLSGTTVDQSQRPRSAPLPGGYQFAAAYYGASQLQSAYGVDTFLTNGYGGRGETIAIIDAYGDPTIYQDMATFDRQFGLPPVDLTVIPVGPYEPSLGITYGWDAETALDVQAAHAMAPYAHINLLIGANASNALYQAVKMVVDQHLGDVVSMSWGIGENSFGESGWSVQGFLNYPYVEYYFQKGAAEGITFFASSGDYGAFSGTTTVTGGWPATSPFVTGVGGTTLYLAPSGPYYSVYNSSAVYQSEEAWSVSPQFKGAQGVSSGGAYSSIFPQPYYQSSLSASKYRASPDVSADANPYTGMVIVLEGADYVIGGTSLASPLWAGMAADLDQYVGRSLGALNPYLYSIYGDASAYSRDFHQVTYGFNGEYQAGPGYNLVTGLGTPNLPNLAADIASQTQSLGVHVTTAAGPVASAPTQFVRGQTITISATVTSSTGGAVQTGSFGADLIGPSGLLAAVPLTYSGGAWTGKYTVSPSDPTGEWTITVTGASGGITGNGIAEVSVGQSLAIFQPLPYPYGSAVTPGKSFTIEAAAATVGDAQVNNATLTANLIFHGKTVKSLLLIPQGQGLYSASTTLGGFDPQGTYGLEIMGQGFATVSSYLYVGEQVTGVMITPADTATPSAAPGQQVIFLAQAETADGFGAFTSNVTVKIFSLAGTQMASVRLQPAPNKAQFGVFNFFNSQQANITIPSNLTQGFYKVQFLSSYKPYGAAAPVLGNFTTGFYVSAPTLTYQISTPGFAYEGQWVQANVRITDAAGSPVTEGVFMATFVPSGYAFEAYSLDASGFTSAPMVYVQALGEWEAQFQIPSPLTSPNTFVGNLPSLPSGPWTVLVGGQSSAGANVVPSSAYVTVLPYVYYTQALIDAANVASAPLVSVNGTGYTLAGIAADSLALRGVKMTLGGVVIGNLSLVDSTVWLDASQVGSLSLRNSTVVLAQGTQVNSLSPALPTMSVSGLDKPMSGSTQFTVNVSGALLSAGSLNATVDGSPIALSSTASSSGITSKGTIDASSLGEGVHILTLTATQSDGLSSTVTKYFSVSTQGSAIANLVNLVYALVAVAVAALLVAVLALIRKSPRPQVPSGLPPQV